MKISIENLEFPLCIRKKILFIKSITKLKLDYIAGKNIQFNKTNLALREPHKIVISNKTSSIVLLNYEYDENLYDVCGNHVSISKLSKVVANMLKGNNNEKEKKEV